MKYAHQGNPFLTWETLSDVARYSLERCIDRVMSGQPGLVTEEFSNGNCYAYACGNFVNYGINGEEGLNLFREQRNLFETGNERKPTMPKKALKLKDWQDEVRKANPDMFDGASKPLRLVDPAPSPLAKGDLPVERKQTVMKRVFGSFWR